MIVLQVDMTQLNTGIYDTGITVKTAIHDILFAPSMTVFTKKLKLHFYYVHTYYLIDNCYTDEGRPAKHQKMSCFSTGWARWRMVLPSVQIG